MPVKPTFCSRRNTQRGSSACYTLEGEPSTADRQRACPMRSNRGSVFIPSLQSGKLATRLAPVSLLAGALMSASPSFLSVPAEKNKTTLLQSLSLSFSVVFFNFSAWEHICDRLSFENNLIRRNQSTSTLSSLKQTRYANTKTVI